jgi:hemoglobin
VYIAALGLHIPLATGSAWAEATLYDRLGGEAGLARIVHGLVQRVTTDPRIAEKFDNINITYFEHRLNLRLCEWTGGPCHGRGGSMKGIHAELDLTDRHFNAVVEDLQDAMAAADTPYRAQNQLLALLAPMHRDIVSH